MNQRKNKKILVLASTFPRWIGDTNPPFVFELSKRLSKEFDITVLAPHFPKSKIYEKMEGLKVYRYRYFFSKFEKLAGNGGILPVLKKNKLYYFVVPFFLIGQLITAIKLVIKNKPDIVHAHWIIPQGLIALILNKIFSIPYIVTSHGGDIFGLQGKVFLKLKNVILSNAKKITVVSTVIKNEVININENLEDKVEIIPMGVDPSIFNKNKYDKNILKKYKVSEKLILYVGRLVDKKGVEYLINSMTDIVKKFPKIKLLIIGDGPLKQKLIYLTSKLNLDNNIIFIGAIKNTDLPKYYATADIFVGPSIKTNDGDTEGFGLTFVEAIMSGCVTFGSNIGGIGDILPKENLFSPNNSRSISKKIISYLQEKEKRKSITNLMNKYSWKEICKQYAKTINK